MLVRTLTLALAVIAAAVVTAIAPSAPVRANGHAMALDADPLAVGIQADRAVSGTFEIALHATAVPSPYQGYQWQISYGPGLAFADSAMENKNATGLSLCAPPQSEVVAGKTELGMGAGCVPPDANYVTSFAGELTRIRLQCQSDGIHAITLQDLNADPNFGSTFLAQQGPTIPTTTAGITVTCGGGGGPVGDCVVAQVVTAERFICQDGRRVRMLQIEAQEPNQCGGEWAKAALQYLFLIPGRTVTLVYDTTRMNGWGEQLAAPVWRGNDGADYNMSIVMVYVGLAKAADLGDGNRMFLDWANAAQTWASVAQWNMWAPGKTYNGGC